MAAPKSTSNSGTVFVKGSRGCSASSPDSTEMPPVTRKSSPQLNFQNLPTEVRYLIYARLIPTRQSLCTYNTSARDSQCHAHIISTTFPGQGISLGNRHKFPLASVNKFIRKDIEAWMRKDVICVFCSLRCLGICLRRFGDPLRREPGDNVKYHLASMDVSDGDLNRSIEADVWNHLESGVLEMMDGDPQSR